MGFVIGAIIIALWLFQVVMYGTWTTFYFKHGPCLFRKSINAASLSEIDFRSLQSALKTNSPKILFMNAFPTMLFKRETEQSIFFKYEVFNISTWNVSIIHGQITADKNQPGIVAITGRLDWYFLPWIFFAALAPLSLQVDTVVAGMCLSAILVFLYLLQKRHFNAMCQILAHQVQTYETKQPLVENLSN